MASMEEFCSCPESWEPTRSTFNQVMELDGNSKQFEDGMWNLCDWLGPLVMKFSDRLLEIAAGSFLEVQEFGKSLRKADQCLVGLAAGAYACVTSTWLANNLAAFERMVSVVVPFFVHTVGCFEFETAIWRMTTGHVLHQVEMMSYYPDYVELNAPFLPLCEESFEQTQFRKSLIGLCGNVLPHRILPGIAGPLEAPESDDIVLITHSSVETLSLVERMLSSWEGPASVSVFAYDAPIVEVLPQIRRWIDRLEELGLRQIVVSLVGPNGLSWATRYDKLYPANLLRQVAVDAALSDLLLLADPGFIPSAQFRSRVHYSSPLGHAVRALMAAMPMAFLVTCFLVYEELSAEFDVALLRQLVETGGAQSFDARICPLCHSYAWQTLLLMESGSLRFPQVERGDLHHPAWLVSRSVLPRFPPFLHGVVGPDSGSSKIGWIGLPCGLQLSAQQMLSDGVQLLLLPHVFFYRHESSPMPNEEDARRWDKFDRFPASVYHNLLQNRVFASKPPKKHAPLVSRSMLVGDRFVEFGHWRQAALVTLRQGADSSVQVIVRASTVLGSEGLQRLVSSVPWTVHAVAVGAADYWTRSKRDLPTALRSFHKDQLVMVVDAYDVMLLPCRRSIVEEFRKFKKDIVFAADTSCFPYAHLCRSCEERYAADSRDLEECRAFPYVNGGGYMGTAASLAFFLEWMNEHESEIGGDSGTHLAGKDLENIYHFYNRFPERVALDHRQRIWSCLFGGELEHFHIQDCRVSSDYVGDDVCVVHANGQTRLTILAPLLEQLEEKGCRERALSRKTAAYDGMLRPASYIS